jgi:hypothetical protein
VRRTFLPLFAAVGLLAGCGGDSNGGLVSQPQPAQPIESLVGPFNKAISAGSCKDVAKLALAITRPVGKPGAPATKRECEFYANDPASPLKALKGVRFDKSAEYGTAALMEGNPSPGSSVAKTFAIWAVDVDGRFRFLSSGGGDAQIGKSPPRPNDAARNAKAFVRSIKDGHCDPKLLNPNRSMLPAVAPKTVCQRIDKGHLAAPAIRATKRVAPEKMGESADFVFFGVPTEKAYFTLIMASEDAKPGAKGRDFTVYDILPSTHLRIR